MVQSLDMKNFSYLKFEGQTFHILTLYHQDPIESTVKSLQIFHILSLIDA